MMSNSANAYLRGNARAWPCKQTMDLIQFVIFFLYSILSFSYILKYYIINKSELGHVNRANVQYIKIFSHCVIPKIFQLEHAGSRQCERTQIKNKWGELAVGTMHIWFISADLRVEIKYGLSQIDLNTCIWNEKE